MVPALIAITVLIVGFRVLRRWLRKDTTRQHPQSPLVWWMKLCGTVPGIYGIAAFMAGFISQTLTNRVGWPANPGGSTRRPC